MQQMPRPSVMLWLDQRPTMRFVLTKNIEQQSVLALDRAPQEWCEIDNLKRPLR